LFLIFFFVMEFKKKLVKPGACFQVCFTIFLMVMSLVVYGFGFAAESFKVVATAFCGDAHDFLNDPDEFLFTMPEFARDVAHECMFKTSKGDISNLIDDNYAAQYRLVEDYLTLLSTPLLWIEYKKDTNIHTRNLHRFFDEYLQEYKTYARVDYTNYNAFNHSFYSQISTLNGQVECTGKEKISFSKFFKYGVFFSFLAFF
jgi:hypothetical protein